MAFEDLTDPPGTVLVVVAHPDDIDFGTAGTVAKLVAAGSNVVYAIGTRGEAGPPEDMDREELADMREAEQRAAASEVGVTDVRFLGLRDGHIEANLETRRVISRVIRDVKPDLVITQSPLRRFDRIYASHPDHLAVGEATMAAVYPDARNPHAHPELLAEGYEPHTVPECWIAGAEPLDVFVDITAVFDRKLAALKSHQSQTSKMDVEDLLSQWAQLIGRTYGLPEGRLVEGFRRVHAI